jgi:4-amino-4-deoxy-L-arabinose transferase-like glycosyltransferase
VAQGIQPGDGRRLFVGHALIALAVVLVCLWVRYRLAPVPLERDEGEYAYAGQLILDGLPPYAHLYNMKLPGIYAAYALVMAVFGETGAGIHLGLLLVNLGTGVLLFLLARRLHGPTVGALAAASYAVLSLGRTVHGIFANAEHFVMLFATGGLLLLLGAVEAKRRGRVFLGGLLLGAGFLMKQHGAAFVLFGLVYVVIAAFRARPTDRRWRVGATGCFLLGAALPYAATCLIFAGLGQFEPFWFWTVTYAVKYVGSMPLQAGLDRLAGRFPGIVGAAIPLWGLAALGVILALVRPKARPDRRFMVGFVLFSTAAVLPGLYFRAHYFLLMLPAVSLAAAVGLGQILTWLTRIRGGLAIGLVAALVPFVLAFHRERHFFFRATPVEASRRTFGVNPFPEAVQVADYIRERSGRGDRIAVIGSEPEIYFHAARRAATGYVYTYALMETHPFAAKMQAEMRAEIERAAPRFLVYVNVPASWLIVKGSDRTILEWSKRYFEAHYERVGLVEILSETETVYHWGAAARGRRPRSNCWLEIGLRRETR